MVRAGVGENAAKHGQVRVVSRLEGPVRLVVGGGRQRQQAAQVLCGRGDQLPAVDDLNRLASREVAIQDCVVPDVDRWASQVAGQLFGDHVEVMRSAALQQAEDTGREEDIGVKGAAVRFCGLILGLTVRGARIRGGLGRISQLAGSPPWQRGQ